ncbi:MAG: hypothetical protein F7B20_01455 [Aeropyrum sp.]|nr:hypothetical protein [Aeropyrum sp.]MCE4616833.1 hypothetical protein [Aeropyrum sp.]
MPGEGRVERCLEVLRLASTLGRVKRDELVSATTILGIQAEEAGVCIEWLESGGLARIDESEHVVVTLKGKRVLREIALSIAGWSEGAS